VSRHASPVVGLAAHPRDGSLLISASEDGTLAVTRLQTSHLVTVMEHLVIGSPQQLLNFSDLPPQDVLVSAPRPGKKQAAAATVTMGAIQAEGDGGGGEGAAAGDVSAGLSTRLCAIDVSAADGSVCGAAWVTHLVVLVTPWLESEAKLLAVYKCEQVRRARVGTLARPSCSLSSLDGWMYYTGLARQITDLKALYEASTGGIVVIDSIVTLFFHAACARSLWAGFQRMCLLTSSS
jgi:hypothetical protein